MWFCCIPNHHAGHITKKSVPLGVKKQHQIFMHENIGLEIHRHIRVVKGLFVFEPIPFILEITMGLGCFRRGGAFFLTSQMCLIFPCQWSPHTVGANHQKCPLFRMAGGGVKRNRKHTQQSKPPLADTTNWAKNKNGFLFFFGGGLGLVRRLAGAGTMVGQRNAQLAPTSPCAGERIALHNEHEGA